MTGLGPRLGHADLLHTTRGTAQADPDHKPSGPSGTFRGQRASHAGCRGRRVGARPPEELVPGQGRAREGRVDSRLGTDPPLPLGVDRLTLPIGISLPVGSAFLPVALPTGRVCLPTGRDPYR